MLLPHFEDNFCFFAITENFFASFNKNAVSWPNLIALTSQLSNLVFKWVKFLARTISNRKYSVLDLITALNNMQIFEINLGHIKKITCQIDPFVGK